MVLHKHRRILPSSDPTEVHTVAILFTNAHESTHARTHPITMHLCTHRHVHHACLQIEDNIKGVSAAIAKSGRPTIYSLSPGGGDPATEFKQAQSIAEFVNIYRVTGDWHGGSLQYHFQIAETMQSLINVKGTTVPTQQLRPCKRTANSTARVRSSSRMLVARVWLRVCRIATRIIRRGCTLEYAFSGVPLLSLGLLSAADRLACSQDTERYSSGTDFYCSCPPVH